MGVTTAYHVASSFINLAIENKSPVSNLKLQKLLYYAQAWHLALFKKPLFDEEIEAWVHGPVVPGVFGQYKQYRWSPITETQHTSIPKAVSEHLQEVWRVYGRFRAFELERLTHSEAPWVDARRGLPPEASSHEVIKKDVMLRYYSSRLNG